MKNTIKNNLTIFCFLALALVLALGSCRKKKCYDPTNRDCENYDPCYGKKTITADFIFGQILVGPDPINGQSYFICQDTIFMSGGVDRRGFNYGITMKFQALESSAKYSWKLGSETILDNEFERSFGVTAPPGVYKATLIVEKTPDAACFPKDDGKDTITKNFTLMPHYQLPVMGVYKVLFEGSKDSTIIEIRPWEISTATQQKNYKIVDSASVRYTTLINFQNKKDTVTHFIFDGITTGNHIYFFDAPDSSRPHSGQVDLIGSNIFATYYYGNSYWNTLKNFTFKGRKIQ